MLNWVSLLSHGRIKSRMIYLCLSFIIKAMSRSNNQRNVANFSNYWQMFRSLQKRSKLPRSYLVHYNSWNFRVFECWMIHIKNAFVIRWRFIRGGMNAEVSCVTRWANFKLGTSMTHAIVHIGCWRFNLDNVPILEIFCDTNAGGSLWQQVSYFSCSNKNE